MDSLDRPTKAKQNQSQQELGKLDAFDIQGGDSHLYSPRADEGPRTYVPKFLPPSLVSIQKITHHDQSRNSEYSRTVLPHRKRVHHESVDFTQGLNGYSYGYGGYESQSVSAQILVDPHAIRDRNITYGTTELGQLSPMEGATRPNSLLPKHNRTGQPSALSQYQTASVQAGAKKV